MNKYKCADAGSENCPCQLGVFGKCLICSRIGNPAAGPFGCEDCSWSGSCIFTLRDQSLRRLSFVREERLLNIEEVKTYLPEFKVFVIGAGKGFCQKARAAGTYIFLRRKGCMNWFDMPVSVLKSEPEKNRIHIGICGTGPKSRDILTAKTGDDFIVRGIFRGGLSGLSNLSNLSGLSNLSNLSNLSLMSNGTFSRPISEIFAKGIAIAPLRNLLEDSRYGISKENLEIHVDLDKIGQDFFLDYFGDIPASSVHIEDFSKGFQQNSMGNVVCALTSPYYADAIERLAGRPVVRPITGSLCCGEGICGACGFDNEKGENVHRCKALDIHP